MIKLYCDEQAEGYDAKLGTLVVDCGKEHLSFRIGVSDGEIIYHARENSSNFRKGERVTQETMQGLLRVLVSKVEQSSETLCEMV